MPQERSFADRFFSFIDLRNRVTSTIPSLTALAYCFYWRGKIDLGGTILYFVTMILLDLPPTMINNYLDRKEAGKVGYFSEPAMIAAILVTGAVGAALGVYMATVYGWAFLLAGIGCFAIGVFYTYGPAPISRSPYAEPASGVALGFGLPFVVTTVNMPGLVAFAYGAGDLLVTFDFWGMARFAVFCAPMIFALMAMMLANNICDYEADMKNRYTMARHVGVPNALRIHGGFYVVVYAMLIAGVIFRATPWTCLIVLLTAPLVFRNVKKFFAKQVKSETFELAIHNLLMITISYALCILAGGLLKL